MFVHRFGDLKLQNPENRSFAQMFQKSYAGKILECHLNLLNVIRTGGYLPDRVTNLVLQYLSNRFGHFSIASSYFFSFCVFIDIINIFIRHAITNLFMTSLKITLLLLKYIYFFLCRPLVLYGVLPQTVILNP